MVQRQAWEKEYESPLLVSKGAAPIQDIKNFSRFIRKKKAIDVRTRTVLDIGCGVGKHTLYFAELGAHVTGIDIARNALTEARVRAHNAALSSMCCFIQHSAGAPYPFQSETFDIAIDVLASHLLNENEREVYLKETFRVLKPGGLFFVKTLAKDGDTHAKKLLRDHPGKEPDTYVLPGMGTHERVFSSEALEATYTPRFSIVKKEKKSNYSRFDGRIYKRHYWILYLEKPVRKS